MKKILFQKHIAAYIKVCLEKKDEDISKNVSESEKPKFEKVIGSNNKADAKIAGITPAVFIFNGKMWDDSPP